MYSRGQQKGYPRRVVMEFLIPSAHFGAVGDHQRFDPPNNHSTAQGYPVPPVGEGSTLRCSESPVADSYTYGVDLR